MTTQLINRIRSLAALFIAAVTGVVLLPNGTVHAADAIISVRTFGGVTIPQGGEFALGTTTVGTPIVHYFSISADESGAALTGVQVSLPSGFSLFAAPPATIQPGTSHSAYVQCDATDPGPVSGTLSIHANELADPYQFTVSCSMVADPAPTIQLLDSSNAVIPHSTGVVDLGEVLFGDTGSAMVRVFNTGTGPLVLDTVGSDTAGFYANDYWPGTVVGGGGFNVYFIAVCDSDTLGLKLATFSVPSNDPDTPVYTFTVACTFVEQLGATPTAPAGPEPSPQNDAGGGAPEPNLPHTGASAALALLATCLLAAGLSMWRVARRSA